MGLRRVVGALAVRRPHVLVAEVPGTFEVRCALERELSRRGWVAASSPADADALVVTGPPGPGMVPCVDFVWQQLPDPRVRTVLDAAPARVEAAIDDLARRLADDGAVRAAAGGRRDGPLPPAAESDDEMAPYDVPLAGGGPDRDGLEMDLLHVPLGPVLTHWPAGLVLTVELHGDVVADAEVSWLDDTRPVDEGAATAARLLDAATSTLRLAGADRLADQALRLRDAALDGADVGPLLEALHDRVARNRVLRWSLAGLAAAPADTAPRADVRARLLHLLTLPTVPTGPLDDVSIPELVAGEELATTRLLVAASAPWAARLTPATGGEEVRS